MSTGRRLLSRRYHSSDSDSSDNEDSKRQANYSLKRPRAKHENRNGEKHPLGVSSSSRKLAAPTTTLPSSDGLKSPVTSSGRNWSKTYGSSSSSSSDDELLKPRLNTKAKLKANDSQSTPQPTPFKASSGRSENSQVRVEPRLNFAKTSAQDSGLQKFGAGNLDEDSSSTDRPVNLATKNRRSKGSHVKKRMHHLESDDSASAADVRSPLLSRKQPLPKSASVATAIRKQSLSDSCARTNDEATTEVLETTRRSPLQSQSDRQDRYSLLDSSPERKDASSVESAELDRRLEQQKQKRQLFVDNSLKDPPPTAAKSPLEDVFVLPQQSESSSGSEASDDEDGDDHNDILATSEWQPTKDDTLDCSGTKDFDINSGKENHDNDWPLQDQVTDGATACLSDRKMPYRTPRRDVVDLSNNSTGSKAKHSVEEDDVAVLDHTVEIPSTGGAIRQGLRVPSANKYQQNVRLLSARKDVGTQAQDDIEIFSDDDYGDGSGLGRSDGTIAVNQLNRRRVQASTYQSGGFSSAASNPGTTLDRNGSHLNPRARMADNGDSPFMSNPFEAYRYSDGAYAASPEALDQRDAFQNHDDPYPTADNPYPTADNDYYNPSTFDQETYANDADQDTDHDSRFASYRESSTSAYGGFNQFGMISNTEAQNDVTQRPPRRIRDPSVMPRLPMQSTLSAPGPPRQFRNRSTGALTLPAAWAPSNASAAAAPARNSAGPAASQEDFSTNWAEAAEYPMPDQATRGSGMASHTTVPVDNRTRQQGQRASSKKTTRRSSAGGGGGGSARQRRGGFRGRGGRGRGGGGGRGGRRGASRTNGGGPPPGNPFWAGNADDPNLRHVGGAEMSF